MIELTADDDFPSRRLIKLIGLAAKVSRAGDEQGGPKDFSETGCFHLMINFKNGHFVPRRPVNSLPE
jgi:hypothetical protein